MNDTTFLPQGYEAPVTAGNYMKLEDGDNLFRVLSSAVVGFEYWNRENKPIRVKTYPENLPADIRQEKDGKPSRIKHFWAFIVWNYKANKIQLLSLTQATIQGQIKNFVDDAIWGDPKGYDIKINRTGEGLDTEYSVSPRPHTPIKSEIQSEFANTPYDLQNLFRGEEVFDVKTSDGTPMAKF